MSWFLYCSNNWIIVCQTNCWNPFALCRQGPPASYHLRFLVLRISVQLARKQCTRWRS
ncbi:LIM domain-containing protein PLIM2b [Zea mays]|uniref:LIM domain-containing protein PLIM2b n=1 Tax=Zea mays TaxID=4577 RepID=A0A1D6JAX0_MAIZE|nr:LIM domain-containing protein PLIM2b [Zea mays]